MKAMERSMVRGLPLSMAAVIFPRMSEPKLFQDAGDELLLSVYEKQGRTLDDLPYTPEFETIFEAMGDGATRTGLFHRLHNLRKAGKLPRLGRATDKPPRIDPAQEELLVELVEAEIGQLSLRDRLPYTPAFDQIVCTFNAQAGLALSPHTVWRIIAKLAK
jgi:hypothetical protein